MTSATILIPARWGSSRFEGKPLTATLRDGQGTDMPLIWWTYQAAIQALPATKVWVATDDARIQDAVEGFGGQALMTSPTCRNGTERVQEAAEALGLSADEIIVNFQGDAPLTPPSFATALIDHMAAHPEALVATPALRCDAPALSRFRDQRARGLVGGTTLVKSASGRALYFSKEVLPFSDGIYADLESAQAPIPVFHHVGLYAYRRAGLDAYMALPPSKLEQIEGLEQLRFLENDLPVDCVEVDAGGQMFWEVNNPEDMALVSQDLARLHPKTSDGD